MTQCERLLDAMRPRKTRWSDEELALLDAYYPVLPTSDLVPVLGRPVHSLQKMAQMRGVRKLGWALSSLRREQAASASESSISRRFKAQHGHSNGGNRAYEIWRHMRERCQNERHKSYADYGGRGIKVCDEWDRSYDAFFADMGTPPPGYTLGRIDNDGNYAPGNCRWETMREQQNNRRSNHCLTAFGRTQTATLWAEEFGMRADTLLYRVKVRRMDAESALTTPIATRQRPDGLTELRVVRESGASIAPPQDGAT